MLATLESLSGVPVLDLLAPFVFVLAWVGYARWADSPGRPSLMARMHEYRLVWMRRMLARDNRITDLQVVQVLVQNIAFFASSAIILIGGLVAVLGAREQAMAILAEMPLAAATVPRVFDAKVLLLIVVFVYAFFKFTWTLRQFNYVAILIGAAPPPAEAATPAAERLIERAARMATRAADHFNKAMRAYYFGLAGLAWFVHPLLLVAAVFWVVLVSWRREFRSASLAILGPVGEPIEKTPPQSEARSSP
ncbi:MAG: DUF599 family protein [Geminicoccaceae bacterium]|nr:DUF599 family protein [Geminicoccaceae bacterium]MCS7267822.1 DUF599 family protein [Geminicoccaceae bacterium]MCX7630721.1 DUF599 family protein [Geminicoccaceae bacterium]MDW8123639.1 DUF599 family protein [Geminicoccaceae bacterium]MDW8342747.1 DUF599 family protein [Geminicoccaceae bacterium]